jgi:tetratricopeptide (TPR) repeat protein
MNWVERLAKWVGVDATTPPNPDVVSIKARLETARVAKRDENYASAMENLDEALSVADKLGDHAATAIIQLHRADILIRTDQTHQAQELTEQIIRTAEQGNQQVTRAYGLVLMGLIERARGNIAGARTLLETARGQAQAANSAGAEGRAGGHLADTFLSEGNASYAAHLLRDALEKLNQGGDLELSSYFVGRLGEALIEIGEETEGDTLLGRALRLADQLKSRGDLRRWHAALGRRALTQGRYAESYNHFEKAITFMAEDAPERVDALREIASACLYLDKQHDALVYAQQSLALSDKDPRIHGTVGIILQSMGRFDEALGHLKIAVEAGDSDLDTQRALAAATLDSGDVEAALSLYNATLQNSIKARLPLEQARTLRDIGHLNLRMHQPQEALRNWMSAVELYQVDDIHAQVARLYCDIAQVRTQIGQGGRAFKEYERALMAMNSAADPLTRGLVLSNAATAYVEQGDPETAEAFFSESIKIAQNLLDEPAEAMRRGNLGWFLLVTGRLPRAQSALEYALQLSRRLKLTLAIAVQSSNLAQANQALGHLDAAAELHEQALAAVDQIDSTHWQAIVRINFAAFLVDQGDFERARTLYDEALERAPLAEDVEGHHRAQIGLAYLDVKKNNPAAALARMAESLPLVRQSGLRRVLAEALTVTSEILAADQQDAEAEHHWNEASKLYKALHHPLGSSHPAWITAPNA